MQTSRYLTLRQVALSVYPLLSALYLKACQQECIVQQRIINLCRL